MQYKILKTTCTLSLLMLTWFASLDTASVVAKAKRKSIRLTQKDKAQIIESILRRELSKKDFAKAETYLFMRDPLFPPELIPAIYKDKIKMIEPEEFRAKEERKEPVRVFFFNEFKVRRSKVIVDFGRSYSAPGYFNENGTIYEYQKVSGKWTGKATLGRMSIFE